MSFLYRSSLIISKKQPYIDWARGLDASATPTAELAVSQQTIYLVPEFAQQPVLSSVLDECWEDIFEEELVMWSEDESSWPSSRTREVFDEWFDAQFTMSVCDLVPDEPLTQSDVELADLRLAVAQCAWCSAEVEPEGGRFAGFTLPDRSRFAHREGLVLPLELGEDHILLGVMTESSSEQAANGEDLIFRACTSRCERAMKSAIPKALKRLR